MVTVYTGYCKGCGLCLVKCPRQSIGWSEMLGFFGTPAVRIDQGKCTLCGQCEILCPDCAIAVEYIPRPRRKNRKIL
ncbi:MAG: 4Fe-4S dicluster domain-containing protein [Peptococcaceae bacterium]|nr:4Fe-4S dicluster domain-containing protein [Peptococcaceae bacterium]